MKNKKFWNWKNQEGNEESIRVLELYGTIAEESWFDDDITPKNFKEELFSGKGPIEIWINSPGGDCIAASQIYAMLMDYPDDVTVKIDGVAASAASVVAMAATEVLIAPTALMMIHNPATGAFGDHVDMTKAIEMLAEVKESIINAYELRTGLSRDELSSMMDNTTWMNAKKTIELGFADDILRDEKREVKMESYAFSASKVEDALINHISRLAKAKPETKTSGRNVDELKASLYKKLL